VPFVLPGISESDNSLGMSLICVDRSGVMSIVHWTDPGHTSVRVWQLTGSPREWTRDEAATPESVRATEFVSVQRARPHICYELIRATCAAWRGDVCKSTMLFSGGVSHHYDDVQDLWFLGEIVATVFARWQLESRSSTTTRNFASFLENVGFWCVVGALVCIYISNHLSPGLGQFTFCSAMNRRVRHCAAM
jgi:hypothetical protein